MITPIIVAAKSQAERVDRLCKYCYELDGTKLVVLPKHEPNEPYPHCNNSAFHQAAVFMKGSPFLWMEADSIPLKPGWVKTLSEEYKHLGKPFMLSSDSNPPHDLVGGIGIYGPDSHFLIPQKIEFGGWDAWMIKHLDGMISKTPLIQHSYGNYNSEGIATPWRFPRDNHIIREDAVLFHADKFQTLIQPDKGIRVSMSGDNGDIIASLPLIRHLGGAHVTIGNHPGYPHNGMRDIKKYYDSIASLLETLPYVKSVAYAEDHHNADYDLTNWRVCWNRYRSLADAQALYAGFENIDLSPWLDANPDPRTKGKVVVARSQRYPNHSFPWLEATRRYRGRMVFIGTPDEYKEWQKHSMGKSEYIPCKNFLEMAELIQGCDFMIANQSSPGWVAMGLGKKLIQESCSWALDSKVPRPENQYVDGSIVEWPK